MVILNLAQKPWKLYNTSNKQVFFLTLKTYFQDEIQKAKCSTWYTLRYIAGCIYQPKLASWKSSCLVWSLTTHKLAWADTVWWSILALVVCHSPTLWIWLRDKVTTCSYRIALLLAAAIITIWHFSIYHYLGHPSHGYKFIKIKNAHLKKV